MESREEWKEKKWKDEEGQGSEFIVGWEDVNRSVGRYSTWNSQATIHKGSEEWKWRAIRDSGAWIL